MSNTLEMRGMKTNITESKIIKSGQVKKIKIQWKQNLRIIITNRYINTYRYNNF